jgi:hypothetical protein
MRFSQFDFDVITSPEEEQKASPRRSPPQEQRLERERDRPEEIKPQE